MKKNILFSGNFWENDVKSISGFLFLPFLMTHLRFYHLFSGRFYYPFSGKNHTTIIFLVKFYSPNLFSKYFFFVIILHFFYTLFFLHFFS
jgi:hypothetical protein